MFLVETGTTDVFRPSSIVGASLSLPVLGTSQLGSAVSMWLFWEHDFDEGTDHALLTLSVDLLNLGAGGTD